MVIPSPPNRSSTIEKYYVMARRYGEEVLSCCDQEIWNRIEALRRCNTVGDALRALLRIAYRAGENSARKIMTAMDQHFGTTHAICPRCGHRYKQHRHDGICPGERKNFVTDPVQPVESTY